jgi:hypothetical protein
MKIRSFLKASAFIQVEARIIEHIAYQVLHEPFPLRAVRDNGKEHKFLRDYMNGSVAKNAASANKLQSFSGELRHVCPQRKVGLPLEPGSEPLLDSN